MAQPRPIQSAVARHFARTLADEGYAVGRPRIEKKFLSSDGTVRYLLAFADGQSVETVWMPEGDGGEAGDGSQSGDEELEDAKAWRRGTICVSSQVGCAVDCAFCMTALLGLKRNLSAGEIVGQILLVLNDQQVDVERDRLNLVFMGQGEPFLNYDNFMQAVRLLVEGVGVSESRMTVSTSGIVPRIEDFGNGARASEIGDLAECVERSRAHRGHADHEEVDHREADDRFARVSSAQS